MRTEIVKIAQRGARTIAAGIVVTALAACAAGPAPVREAALTGVENYSRIEGSSGFAGPIAGFGGATQPSAMPGLKREGFNAVINLRLATEEGAEIDASRAAAEAAGMNFVHLPFNPKKLDTALVDEFIEAAGKKANQPVYVHCGSATRAAALWMIARVLKDGLTVDDAATEARAIAAKPDDAVALATGYLATEQQKDN